MDEEVDVEREELLARARARLDEVRTHRVTVDPHEKVVDVSDIIADATRTLAKAREHGAYQRGYLDGRRRRWW